MCPWSVAYSLGLVNSGHEGASPSQAKLSHTTASATARSRSHAHEGFMTRSLPPLVKAAASARPQHSHPGR